MNSSTNVHASDGTVQWRIDDKPTYLALKISTTDDFGGQHDVTLFCSWDQLADLCERLTESENVSRTLLRRARAALRDRGTSAERSAHANAISAQHHGDLSGVSRLPGA